MGEGTSLTFSMVSNIVAFLALFCAPIHAAQSSTCAKTTGSLYEYSRQTLPEFGGKTVSFDSYKGNVVIAVNVATF